MILKILKILKMKLTTRHFRINISMHLVGEGCPSVFESSYLPPSLYNFSHLFLALISLKIISKIRLSVKIKNENEKTTTDRNRVIG